MEGASGFVLALAWLNLASAYAPKIHLLALPECGALPTSPSNFLSIEKNARARCQKKDTVESEAGVFCIRCNYE